MSNETISEDLILKVLSKLSEDETTNKATLVMTCITTLIVTLKPLFYYWVDAKYGKNKKDENIVHERDVNPLPLDNVENADNNQPQIVANTSTATNNGAIQIFMGNMNTQAQTTNNNTNNDERSVGYCQSSDSSVGNDSQNL